VENQRKEKKRKKNFKRNVSSCIARIFLCKWSLFWHKKFRQKEITVLKL
jgi:hypothetical protein